MIFADYANKWSIGFQDPASEWMYGIIELHDSIVFYLIIIFSVVMWVFISGYLQKDH